MDSEQRKVTRSIELNVWHVVYLYHPSTQQRHDLKTAIHKELKGTGEVLPQNDRDINMWFRKNYEDYHKGTTMSITAPDILFKQRIQACKCLHKTRIVFAKKYPIYKLM